MQSVKVKVTDLMTRLQKNREDHRHVFEEALVGYRAKAVASLEAMLEDARKGKQIRHSLNLEIPMEHTRDYDRVLAMCEMSAEPIIELTQQEFACYAMDDWGWKGAFTQTTSNYR